MSKHEKLVQRLKSRPKDFTFQELAKLLEGFGYRLSNSGKTSGSAVRFIHAEYPPIMLHKPHPEPVLKPYLVAKVLAMLQQEGLV